MQHPYAITQGSQGSAGLLDMSVELFDRVLQQGFKLCDRKDGRSRTNVTADCVPSMGRAELRHVRNDDREPALVESLFELSFERREGQNTGALGGWRCAKQEVPQSLDAFIELAGRVVTTTRDRAKLDVLLPPSLRSRSLP